MKVMEQLPLNPLYLKEGVERSYFFKESPYQFQDKHSKEKLTQYMEDTFLVRTVTWLTMRKEKEECRIQLKQRVIGRHGLDKFPLSH